MQCDPVMKVSTVDKVQQLTDAVDELQSMLRDLEGASAEMGQLQGVVSAATAALQQELVVRAVRSSVALIDRLIGDVMGQRAQEQAAADRARAKHQAELQAQHARLSEVHDRLNEVQARATRLQAELISACEWIERLCSDGAIMPGFRDKLIADARQSVEHFSV